jgi:hypothetical protein
MTNYYRQGLYSTPAYNQGGNKTFKSDEYSQKGTFPLQALFRYTNGGGGRGASETCISFFNIDISNSSPQSSNAHLFSFYLRFKSYIFSFPQFISFLPTRSHFLSFSFPLINILSSRTANIFPLAVSTQVLLLTRIHLFKFKKMTQRQQVRSKIYPEKAASCGPPGEPVGLGRSLGAALNHDEGIVGVVLADLRPENHLLLFIHLTDGRAL